MSKRIIVAISFVVLLVFCGFVDAFHHPSDSPQVSSDEAMQHLKEGNDRFIAGQSLHPHSELSQLKLTAEDGQHPIATVLGCSDSRVPHELLFDQGFGDIFSVRVAGNVCADIEMGSIEYAIEHLQTPLLVVLGHTQCGAVTAAVKHDHAEGHVKSLVDHIVPAVERAKKLHPDLSPNELVNVTVEENVYVAIETLLKESEIVRKAVESQQLKIVPAVYDISTGKVEWLETSKISFEEEQKTALPQKLEHATNNEKPLRTVRCDRPVEEKKFEVFVVQKGQKQLCKNRVRRIVIGHGIAP